MIYAPLCLVLYLDLLTTTAVTYSWAVQLLHGHGNVQWYSAVAWTWKCTVVQCSALLLHCKIYAVLILRIGLLLHCNGYIGVAWTWTVVQCSCCCHKSCIFRGFLYFVCCQPSVIGSSLIPCLLYCRCCCSIFRGLLYFVCTANLISTNVICTSFSNSLC